MGITGTYTYEENGISMDNRTTKLQRNNPKLESDSSRKLLNELTEQILNGTNCYSLEELEAYIGISKYDNEIAKILFRFLVENIN